MSLTLDEQIKVWTTVELAAGFVAFCLPSLRRLFGNGARMLRSWHAPGKSAEEDEYVSAFNTVTGDVDEKVSGNDEEVATGVDGTGRAGSHGDLF